MIGEKLKLLTRYFLDQRLCSAEQLDAYMDDAKLQLVCRKNGDGLKLCVLLYDGMFEFERLTCGPDRLLAHLAIWLNEYDTERNKYNLADPDVGVGVHEAATANKTTADVEVKIEFREEIEMVEDETGEFIYKGKKYRLAATTVDVADTAAVGTSQAEGADAPYSS